MGKLRELWIELGGRLSFSRQKRRAQMMAQFSQAERGSAYDMLAAAELTERREMRRKYLEHALDESRHARLFRNRALELGVSRENAAIIDIGYITESGIVGGETLFERLGEIEFLAFVHDAESRALEQFDVYQKKKIGDQKSLDMLKFISKDEIFHKTYSGAAVKQYCKEEQEVDKIYSRLWWNRKKEAWLRGSRHIGNFMGKFWLTLLYMIVVAPFRILARMEPTGWIDRDYDPSLERAKAQF